MIHSQLLNAVTERLNQYFNQEKETIRIYLDHVNQGLQEPCFFVNSLEGFHRRSSINQVCIENSFCIQYLPGESVNLRKELNEIVDKLYQCLEVIEVGKGIKITGIRMKHSISEDVLQFFISYIVYVTELEQKEYMEELVYNQKRR